MDMPHIFDTQWFIKPDVLNSPNKPECSRFAIVDHNDDHVLTETFMSEKTARYIANLHNASIGL